MSEYQAGDDITLRLRVVPDGGVLTDGTTTATVVARLDDGTERSPTAYPNTDRSEWSAVLTGAAAGEWSVWWTVTGTGSGVQSYDLLVGSGPDAAPLGRVYATVAQLAAEFDPDPLPANARKLLRRASAKVDELLVTAHYAVDEHGMPTDARVAEAMAQATCAQVEWWGEIGDTNGTGAVSALAGSQIGTVKLAGGNASASGGSGSIEYAPEAVSILRRARLSTQGPRIPGPQQIGIRGRYR